MAECVDEVGRQLLDPIGGFMDWLGQEMSDLSARVDANSEVQAASEALADCLGAIGLQARSEAELLQELFDALVSIDDDLAAGEITAAEAGQRRDALESAERAVAVEVNKCLDSFTSVKTRVSDSLIDRFIEENLAAAREELTRLRDASMEDLTEFIARE